MCNTSECSADQGHLVFGHNMSTDAPYQIAPNQLPFFLAYFLVDLRQILILPLPAAGFDKHSDKAGSKDGRQERKPGHVYPLLNTESRCLSMLHLAACCIYSITPQCHPRDMNQCVTCMVCVMKALEVVLKSVCTADRHSVGLL